MNKKGITKKQRILVNRHRGTDELDPSDKLFHDFDKLKKDLEKKFSKGSVEAHNQAFLNCNYETRF